MDTDGVTRYLINCDHIEAEFNKHMDDEDDDAEADVPYAHDAITSLGIDILRESGSITTGAVFEEPPLSFCTGFKPREVDVVD